MADAFSHPLHRNFRRMVCKKRRTRDVSARTAAVAARSIAESGDHRWDLYFNRRDFVVNTRDNYRRHRLVSIAPADADGRQSVFDARLQKNDKKRSVYHHFKEIKA